MKIIGLTGGIGSGKSTVLKMFEALGATTYIADLEAKKLMNTNAELIKQITNLFGQEAYTNKQLNSKYISSIVFNDNEKLKALNNLVHPVVREHFKKFTNNCDAAFVIYEAAILFESGSHQFCNYIITVTANLEDRILRTMQRDQISRAQVLARINNQISDNFKITNAHFVIQNNAIKSTQIQVKTAYDIILALS
jgi:dephospho-CoA kinase